MNQNTESNSERNGVEECRWVTGWLVIMEGKGRGQTLPLFAGGNRVGRGPSNEVRLDYGDDTITEAPMCNIVFDLKTQRHYLLHPGKGVTAFINGELTSDQIALEGEERLRLGETVLRVVVFAGDFHDWDWPIEPKGNGTSTG